jgi:hypothetical protein
MMPCSNSSQIVGRASAEQFFERPGAILENPLLQDDNYFTFRSLSVT